MAASAIVWVLHRNILEGPTGKWPCRWSSTDHDGSDKTGTERIGPVAVGLQRLQQTDGRKDGRAETYYPPLSFVKALAHKIRATYLRNLWDPDIYKTIAWWVGITAYFSDANAPPPYGLLAQCKIYLDIKALRWIRLLYHCFRFRWIGLILLQVRHWAMRIL